jgi:sn-glycerol 3-phosphate transport system substrate-binding protein
VQERWYKRTGYLPLGIEGIYKPLIEQGLSHSLQIAKNELQDTPMLYPVIHSGAANQIRAINDEALEMIFAGIKSPKDAIDEAVARANVVQRRFIRNTSPF